MIESGSSGSGGGGGGGGSKSKQVSTRSGGSSSGQEVVEHKARPLSSFYDNNQSMDEDEATLANSLTVRGDTLTVCDELLEDDGRKFFDLLLRIAESRYHYRDELSGLDASEFDDDDFDDLTDDSENDDDDDLTDDSQDEDSDYLEEQRMQVRPPPPPPLPPPSPSLSLSLPLSLSLSLTLSLSLSLSLRGGG